MGTASFYTTKYGKNRGSGAATAVSSDIRTSGAFTTALTAANLTDSTAATVTMHVGELLCIHADEAMRVRFGGVVATATSGLFVPAGEERQFECDNAGTVSIIDVA